MDPVVVLPAVGGVVAALVIILGLYTGGRDSGHDEGSGGH